MGAKKQRIEFSKGRTEFISVKEEVLGLFASGISKRKIFKIMYKEEKFTMRYNTFRYHLNKFTSDESANKNSKAKTGGQDKAPKYHSTKKQPR